MIKRGDATDHPLDARAQEALDAARAMPRGAEKTEALKNAGLLRAAANIGNARTIERHHSPDYFRKRAEEYRAKAEGCADHRARSALTRIAETFDGLALRAEKIRTIQD
jgi:hypothetical protein